MKKRKTSIWLTEKDDEHIAALRERTGLPSDTGIIRHALYVAVRANGQHRPPPKRPKR